jgi:hypothetical protein
MQLARKAALLALASACLPSSVSAEDRIDFSTTWFQESRKGNLGGLTVFHPQLDFGIDVGETVSLGGHYSADVVSGATASVYSVDAVTSATKFDDVRNEGSISLGFRGSRSQLTFGVGTAGERDYLSLNFSGSGSVDLPGKNTNLALSYSHSMDEVCDRENANTTPLERVALIGDDECKKNVIFGEDVAGATAWRALTIDTVQATLTQNVSPTIVAQVGLYGQVLQGFQSNPYRRVRVSGREAQEGVPDVRARTALLLRVNKFLPSLKAAVHGMVRGYSDTWGVESVTLEFAYSQYLGDHLLLRARGRIYQQDAASFFKDAFFYDTEGPANAYFTGDRELGPLRHFLPGAKLTYLAFNDDGKTFRCFSSCSSRP